MSNETPMTTDHAASDESQFTAMDLAFGMTMFNLLMAVIAIHGDMQNYFAAKLKLFTEYNPKHCVINLDDPRSSTLLERIPDTSTVITYALHNSHADVYLEGNTLYSPWGSGELNSPLLGAFNQSNLLACIAVCALQGIALETILKAVPNLQAVPGRMPMSRWLIAKIHLLIRLQILHYRSLALV